MNKTNPFLALILILFSQMALASTQVAGDWCQNAFDDFNTVMTISEQGDIRRAKVGVNAGESGDFETGFISVGASGINMQLSKKHISVYYIKVKKHWLTGQETLHIKYNDEQTEVFNRCTLDWIKVNK